MKHRRTDPACRLYREPRTRASRWWHNRHRGRACLRCIRPSDIVRRMADELRRRIDEGTI